MGQFSNSFPKHFSYLCEYAFRFDLSCSSCEYPFIFHCLHCSPSCFDPDSLILAYLWLGLSWIDCISANKRFSSSKTSSRKPYTSSKQQGRHKNSVEITITFSPGGGGAPCPGLVGTVVARGLSSGGVGQPLRGLLIVLMACFSTWAVRGRCGVGPGVPWGGVCGTGVSQPGGCGRVVLGGVGPPLSGPSGAGSAVYGPRAGYCVCGVRGSVGRGIFSVLWPRCGARGW